MADVVITTAVEDAKEAQLFDQYVNRFVADCCETGWADGDAPLLMMHADPIAVDRRTLIFQEPDHAAAFSTGWSRARSTGLI